MSVTLGGDLRQALAELCQAQLEIVYLFVDLVSVCLFVWIGWVGWIGCVWLDLVVLAVLAVSLYFLKNIKVVI